MTGVSHIYSLSVWYVVHESRCWPSYLLPGRRGPQGRWSCKPRGCLSVSRCRATPDGEGLSSLRKPTGILNRWNERSDFHQTEVFLTRGLGLSGRTGRWARMRRSAVAGGRHGIPPSDRQEYSRAAHDFPAPNLFTRTARRRVESQVLDNLCQPSFSNCFLRCNPSNYCLIVFLASFIPNVGLRG